jgi:hypothetical protein
VIVVGDERVDAVLDTWRHGLVADQRRGAFLVGRDLADP